MTPELLIAATGCTPERAAQFAGPLNFACLHYGIEGPTRLAAFLAQIGHESGSLRHVREVWGPTPAQQRYEGRADLGNTEPGDGKRYMGRGLIQITGRANYAAMRDRLRAVRPDAPDFVMWPDLLEHPEWAAWSAACYWDWRGLNAPADAGQFETITRRINGGLNGQADRLARWARAKKAIPTVSAEPVTEEESAMPLPAFVAAALPAIVSRIPSLGKLFGSGSEVAERNVKAAELAVGIVQESLGAKNAQEAAEIIASDPVAAKTAADAIAARWLELSETGGGGIDGARKADAAAAAGGDMLRSPSFWVALALLPLVYLVVGSVVGLWGGEWPSDVRAAIATAVVSLVVGGLMGYYYGQSTSRNRTPARE